MRGTLFLVAGPSGAGKDSLIEAARASLAPLGTHIFPRRAITRAAEAGGEIHLALSEAEFEASERAGQFAFSWRAHGFAYGVPVTIGDELARGRHVVVNVSRSIVEAARKNFTPVKVIEVTAPRDVLSARLHARGRESEAEIGPRLARPGGFGADAVVINDGALYSAVALFLAALKD